VKKLPLPFLCACLLAALVPGPLNAQTALELDGLLDAPAVTSAQAARFVLAAAGVLPAELSPEDAFSRARESKWLGPNAESGEAISLGALSGLVMGAFGLRGGFLYALFPGPRYAYRALIRRGLIQGFADPALQVPGERFLLILGRALDYAGDETAGGKP
jgi:hypothetical protein